MAARTASAAGKATISISFKSNDDHPPRAYWTPLTGLIALLSVLQELVGGEAEVFADFGTITISEVDLVAFVERLTAAK